MNALEFKPSNNLTIGTEIELQLLDPWTGNLTPRIDHVLSSVSSLHYNGEIKPEVTRSMVEITSTIHKKINSLDVELNKINNILINESKNIGVNISGCGTHPFQTWKDRVVCPEYKTVHEKYDFLIKKFTVFGQHIHIGCSDPNTAIYLIHAFSRYIPHLVALSASSPFYDGSETLFHSTRLHLIDAFPLSGHFPLVKNWDDFQEYISKLKDLKVIEGVHNFYWDIRLRPEFGTLEIRICDTPLTLKRAISLVAYVQTLAMYFMEEPPIKIQEDLYLPYAHNRFQASRYGLQGKISIENSSSQISIKEDILNTLLKLKNCSKFLGTEDYLEYIYKTVNENNTDSEQIKSEYDALKNMNALAQFQSKQWMNLHQ
jgi:glutamate---cysteine ligase / carboxylate-amine ligase